MHVVNMAAPSSLQAISRTLASKHLISPLVFSRCTKATGASLHNDIGHTMSASSFANRIAYSLAAPPSFRTDSHSDSYSNSSIFRITNQSNFIPEYSFKAVLFGGFKTAQICCFIPTRHYGRKLRQNPPKIETFAYSGDLRTLPELDKNTVLYKYRELEDQLEGNEALKKLTTLEFASSKECSEHKRQLVKDRILELFGTDSELETRIALLTLSIRQLIPHCLKFRMDKVKKTVLVRCIGSRRKLLTQLRSVDHERFEWLLRELKIRYVIPRDHEEYKGWKHNKRVATQDEAATQQKTKLEELKAQFEVEKQVFFQYKAKVMAEMEEDLKKFGLSESFLRQQLEKDKIAAERLKRQQYWEQIRASREKA